LSAPPYTSHVQGRITPLIGMPPDEVQAWRRLAKSAVEPNPFFGPDNLLPAAAHLEGGSELVLAIAEEGGRAYAAVPLRRLARWGRFVRPVLTSRGLEAPMGLGMPLIAAERSYEAAVELLRAIGRDGTAGLLVLDWMGTGGPVETIVRAAADALKMPIHVYDHWARSVLYRRAGAAVLSPKRATALGRWRRGLERQLGGPPKFVDSSGDPGWADQFLSLEAAGWKGALAPGQGALAHYPGGPAWFREAAIGLGREGAARMFSLESEDHVVAMMYALSSPGQALFTTRMCFDETFRTYAPGVQMLVGAVQFFLEDELAGQFCDSCNDRRNAHFPEFLPQLRPMASMVVGTGGTVDRMAVAAMPVVRASGHQVLQAARALKRAVKSRAPAGGAPGTGGDGGPPRSGEGPATHAVR